jgi:hypothetical protein
LTGNVVYDEPRLNYGEDGYSRFLQKVCVNPFQSHCAVIQVSPLQRFLLREYTPQLFVTHRLLHGQSSGYNAEENREKSATFHSGTRLLDVGGGIQHVTVSFGFQQHFRGTFQSGDVMLRR